MKVKSQSEVAQLCWILATPWIAAYQAPPSMGFFRQEYFVKTTYIDVCIYIIYIYILILLKEKRQTFEKLNMGVT